MRRRSIGTPNERIKELHKQVHHGILSSKGLNGIYFIGNGTVVISDRGNGMGRLN